MIKIGDIELTEQQKDLIISAIFNNDKPKIPKTYHIKTLKDVADIFFNDQTNNQRKLSDYYLDSGYPLKCIDCNSVNIKSFIKSTEGGCASEIAYVCNYCGNEVSYWAYGSFNPGYRIEAKLLLKEEQCLNSQQL